MKSRIQQLLSKIPASLAALAMLCAISNVNSTCMFLTSQPDVPEGLTDYHGNQK